ncbi:MAG: hypothetical protein V1754_06790, partial [Pseudomonadota bacterium]
AKEDSPHALDMLGHYQERDGNFAAATKAWRKAVELVPDLGGYFFVRLEKVLFELKKLDELDRLAKELLERYPKNIHVRLAHARFDSKRNPKRALATLTALLDENPRLLPARREAARLVLQEGDGNSVRKAFEEMLSALAEADKGYRCMNCGHAENDLFWRCPSCDSWDSTSVAWGRRAGEKPRS